jgi:myo-inositol-hexaphosphate 3-phosphohydrolase
MSPTTRSKKIGAALGLVLTVAAAPFLRSASAAQPTTDATATAETATVTNANANDPAIWVNPSDAAKSMIIGANDTRLSTYDMSGAVLAQGAAGAAGDFTGVDVRNGFMLGGSPVSVVTAVGRGIVHFYTIDPTTRALTDKSATAGGFTLPKHQGSMSNVCMYQNLSGKTYAFLMADNGMAQQLELTDQSGKIGYTIVRGFDDTVKPAAPFWDVAATNVDGCVADDETGTLYVSERTAGIWKMQAEPNVAPAPALIDTPAASGGHLMPTAKGLAIVRTGAGAGYLLASTFDTAAPAVTDASFNVYDRSNGNTWIRTFKVMAGMSPSTVDNCHESQGIDAAFAPNLAAGFTSGMFLCQDNATNRPTNGGAGFEADNYKMVPLEAIVDPAGPPLPTTTTTAPEVTPTTAPTQLPNRSGYWMIGTDGKVYAFGDAKRYGDASLSPGAQAVDLEPTPSGNGYWIVDDQGHIYNKGDAKIFGGDVDRSLLSSTEIITSISSTKSGNGYWVFTNLGRVVPFGDATFYGEMSKTKLNGPVLDSIPTASGKGYYMVGSDGGIFSFGDAEYKGSMGGKPLNKPVQSLVPDGDGSGYWLVASDGGIFAFDAGFRGSMGGKALNRPVTGMVRYGSGYLMVAEDGGIFNFSDRDFAGSLGATPPAKPITSVAVLDVAPAKTL